MEENQGAEQTPRSLLSDQLDTSFTKQYCKLLKTVCFVKTTRHVEATKGSSKHQTTKFTTFKHYSYTHGVNVKIKTENSVTVLNGRKSNADNIICKVN